MTTTTAADTSTNSPLLTPEERLKLWQRCKGMWKNRTPDPVEELEKMRQELGPRLSASAVTSG